MKKVIVIVFSLLVFSAFSFAQPRAVGIRAAYGGEISYQHYLGGSNFAEFDLGWFSGYSNLVGIYDFLFSAADNFNFYAGPGASLSVYEAVNSNGNSYGALGIAVVGQLGLEYQIQAAPINLSLDWRPAVRLFGDERFGWDSVALGLRYRF